LSTSAAELNFGSGGTRLLAGLIGAGIGPSLTPELHEREGAEQGLTYVYRRIDLDVLALGVEALPDLLTAAERMGFAGVNVTYPCKQRVIPLLTRLSPEAAAIGAVNTVVLGGGRRVGHNTDWSGFARSFRRDLADARRERVVQFGAGGAGAAVAHAVLSLGVSRLALVDTDHDRAARLAGELCTRFGAGRAVLCGRVDEELSRADGVINATPVGMAKHPGMPVDAKLIRPDLWVADIVYFPLVTELLRVARARGCRTMSGAGMAVFQAADAFQLLTGHEADVERMLRHFAAMIDAAAIADTEDLT
jgi:quinate/shikimate dehydrogenase (NAD+)